MGILKFSPEDYKADAVKYRDKLLVLPIVALKTSTDYMTIRPGIRGKEVVGTALVDAQLAPHKVGSKSTSVDLTIEPRTLETYLGTLSAEFEPNSAASTIYAQTGATMGEGQKQQPTAVAVLEGIARRIGHNLNSVLWSAKRNPAGNQSKDLFDGFDTITAAEITAGKLTAEKKNYVKLTEAITKDNACKVLKQVLFGLNQHLRAEEAVMFCSQEIADAYNENYLLTHGATPYNQQYGQQTLEGSGGRLTIVPLPNKADSKYIHITTKSNMLVGCDQMGDEERVGVEKYSSWALTYEAAIYFGVQFESVDPSRLCVVELFQAPQAPQTEAAEQA